MSSGGVFSSGHSYHSYFNLLAEVKKQPFLLSLIFTNYHKPEKSLKGNSQKQENKLLKREKIYMYKYALLGQEFSTNMLKKKKKQISWYFPSFPLWRTQNILGGGKSF